MSDYLAQLKKKKSLLILWEWPLGSWKQLHLKATVLPGGTIPQEEKAASKTTIKETRLSLPTYTRALEPRQHMGRLNKGGLVEALTGWSPYSWTHGCHSRTITPPLTNLSPAGRSLQGRPCLFLPSSAAMGPLLSGALLASSKRSSFLFLASIATF